MGERHLTLGTPGIGKPDAALEELTILVQERDQRNRCVQDARDQPSDSVEGKLGWRVEQAGRIKGRQAVAMRQTLATADVRELCHSHEARLLMSRVVRKPLQRAKPG